MSVNAQDIDQRVYDLYDEYCHGRIDRREFLRRASVITVAGISGLTMAQALLPRYAEAQTVSFTDERITPTYVDYDSPVAPRARCAVTWSSRAITVVGRTRQCW